MTVGMTSDFPLYYIIAGEPSGDLLGASLMVGLSARLSGKVRFAGIGGASMRAQGLTSLFPVSDLSVMGLAEVLPRIPKILGRIDQTVSDIRTSAPVAVITIDSWGFCGRVQKALKREAPQIKRFHYVAPMVWVWKSGRTKTLAKTLDMLMTLLPFEPPWFEKEGLKTVCVGHPVIESQAGQGDGAAYRLRHGIASDAPILVVLPGSRHSETKRLLPIFEQTVHQLAATIPNLNVIIPTVEGVASQVHKAVEHWSVPVTVTLEQQDKFDGFAAATAALAASGTVSLELAMARVPMVVAYKVSPLSAFVAIKFLGLRLKYVSLLNILSDALIVPEFLQSNCRAEMLIAALAPLFVDGPERQAQCQGLKRVQDLLGGSGDSPSLRAADAVLSAMKG